ncbi:MAG TPA: hypothetical protein VF691_20125 [Cytophagaceae bacterium]|jgi:hypothetical protein
MRNKNFIKSIQIFLLSLLPYSLFAQEIGVLTKKNEAIAIGIFFVLATIFITIYYLSWKNRGQKKSGDKYKIKTVEVMRNGRKIVVSKKYRVVSEKEFPAELKRKK